MYLSFYGIKFTDLISTTIHWSWSDIYYGYKFLLIEKKVIWDFANFYVSSDYTDKQDYIEETIDLLVNDNNDFLNNEDILIDFFEKTVDVIDINDDSYTKIKQKWLYIVTLNVYRNKNNFGNIDSIYDCIYSFFDYPKEISFLINYMPKINNKSKDENMTDYLKNYSYLLGN
jgi:hypothetical protein